MVSPIIKGQLLTSQIATEIVFLSNYLSNFVSFPSNIVRTGFHLPSVHVLGLEFKLDGFCLL